MAKTVVRKPKKKSNPLKSAKIDAVDYKDTALLRKFISDRGRSAHAVSLVYPFRSSVRSLVP